MKMRKLITITAFALAFAAWPALAGDKGHNGHGNDDAAAADNDNGAQHIDGDGYSVLITPGGLGKTTPDGDGDSITNHNGTGAFKMHDEGSNYAVHPDGSVTCNGYDWCP